jgi:hypothetical protein
MKLSMAIPLAGALTLALAACGSSDDGGGELGGSTGRGAGTPERGSPSEGQGAPGGTSGGGAGSGGNTSTTPPAPKSGGGQARTYYSSTLHPSLQSTCTACHATGSNGAPIFLAQDASASYDVITSGKVGGILVAPANSILLLHGAHTGPALTSAQVPLVTQWLDLEVAERGITNSPTAETTTSALQKFAACMSETDFTDKSTGLAVSDLGSNNTQTNNSGPCRSCHDRGDGGFWASGGVLGGVNQTDLMFQSTRQFPYIKRYVTGIVDGQGNFQSLQPSNEIATKSALAAECTGPNCHPRFQLPSQLVQAINAWVQRTLTKMQSGQCAPQSIADAGPG